MSRRPRTVAALLPVLIFLLAPPLSAQQTATEDLRKQIEALSQTVLAMQKDLQEIKALLQGKAPPAPPPTQSVLLDIGGHPSRGENTARLTLVEFSDYQ
jgi:protein-disulfide isomerase